MLIKKIAISLLLIILPSALFSQGKYKNVMISSEKEPNELVIAFSPYDNKYMVVAANLDAFYYSLDGGLSWQIRNISNPEYGVWGDPCLVFDIRGSLYYFHLASNSKYWYDRIICQKSFDGGITWDDNGTFIGNNPPNLQDKEWAVCDMTYSPFRNNIYVVWTQCGQESFDRDLASKIPDDVYGSNIFFSRSGDGGESWSRMKRINEKNGTPCAAVDSTVLGATNCIGINGEVYVSWVGPYGVIFDRSGDAGDTWLEKDIIVSPLPGGFKYNVPGIYRTFGFTSMSCDHSAGANRGSVYICWADQRNGNNNTDVWIAKSTDEGYSWSQPLKVNDDITNTHQFFSWMTIDQSNGYIYVVFYDRRNYQDSQTDVYLAKSTDGGLTFLNERISQWPFEPDQSVFFGDYIGISANNGIVRPVWTRLEGTMLSVWTAIINE